jgi:hypothetical protein
MLSRLVALLAAAVLVSACDPVDVAAPDSDSPSTSAGPSAREAQSELKSLTVHVEDTGAHYKRDDWGDWSYDSKTKCNTRELVLKAAGHDLKTDSQCRSTCPADACWTSSYDGVKVSDAAKLQIDHIVPVSQAAHSGTRNWTADQRKKFYNDLDNLTAVTGHSNDSKGDKDPARWRPPNHDSWCDYARHYVMIKSRYHLTVDEAEKSALTSMLNTCK